MEGDITRQAQSTAHSLMTSNQAAHLLSKVALPHSQVALPLIKAALPHQSATEEDEGDTEEVTEATTTSDTST